MSAGQIGHQLRQHLEPDEKAMQRILVELVGAREDLVEEGVLALDVADQRALASSPLSLK